METGRRQPPNRSAMVLPQPGAGIIRHGCDRWPARHQLPGHIAIPNRGSTFHQRVWHRIIDLDDTAESRGGSCSASTLGNRGVLARCC